MGGRAARAPRRHLRATVRVVVIDTAQYDTQIERTVYWRDECAKAPEVSLLAAGARILSHPILMSQNRCHLNAVTSLSSLTSHP